MVLHQGFEWFNCTPVRVNRKSQNNHPVIFESFRVGSAKNKLAGSIPALSTKTRMMCRGGNQTTLLFLG